MEWLLIAGVVALVASKRNDAPTGGGGGGGGADPVAGAAAAGFTFVNSMVGQFGGALTALIADPPSQPQQPGGGGPNLNPLDGSETDRAAREARDRAQASGRGAAAATDRAVGGAIRNASRMVW